MRTFVASFRLLLLLGMTISVTTCATPSYAKIKGCAPSIPPPVAGPLVRPAPTPGLLVINEVLWNPRFRWNCSDQGAYTITSDAWVELYNSGKQALDLYGVHASLDSGLNSNPYYFPFGAAIAPNGYFVLFPRLSSLFVVTETTTLRLLISGTIVDEITIPSLNRDESYTRIPDGANNWQIVANPTIDASNSSSQATPISTNTGKQNGSVGTSGTGEQQVKSRSSAGSGPNGTSPSTSEGTQPAWSNLHLPTPTATTVAFSTPITSSTPIQSISSSSDIPRKLFISLLLILLAVTAFWCWRLFRKT